MATANKKAAVLTGLLGFSLLPMWRPAGGYKGQNLWQYLGTTVFVEKLEHITVEEAIENARLAYCEVMGLSYEEAYAEPHATRILLLPELLALGATAMTLPMWRSGLHESLTGWEWAWHHTGWGPEVTHIPREDYVAAFEKAYGGRQ